jgi:hypothetical protein
MNELAIGDGELQQRTANWLAQKGPMKQFLNQTLPGNNPCQSIIDRYGHVHKVGNTYECILTFKLEELREKFPNVFRDETVLRRLRFENGVVTFKSGELELVEQRNGQFEITAWTGDTTLTKKAAAEESAFFSLVVKLYTGVEIEEVDATIRYYLKEEFLIDGNVPSGSPTMIDGFRYPPRNGGDLLEIDIHDQNQVLLLTTAASHLGLSHAVLLRPNGLLGRVVIANGESVLMSHSASADFARPMHPRLKDIPAYSKHVENWPLRKLSMIGQEQRRDATPRVIQSQPISGEVPLTGTVTKILKISDLRHMVGQFLSRKLEVAFDFEMASSVFGPTLLMFAQFTAYDATEEKLKSWVVDVQRVLLENFNDAVAAFRDFLESPLPKIAFAASSLDVQTVFNVLGCRINGVIVDLQDVYSVIYPNEPTRGLAHVVQTILPHAPVPNKALQQTDWTAVSLEHLPTDDERFLYMIYDSSVLIALKSELVSRATSAQLQAAVKMTEEANRVRHLIKKDEFDNDKAENTTYKRLLDGGLGGREWDDVDELLYNNFHKTRSDIARSEGKHPDQVATMSFLAMVAYRRPRSASDMSRYCCTFDGSDKYFDRWLGLLQVLPP